MHGVDVIVFTAGVGENSDPVRAKVLEGLEFMGVYWDAKKNEGIHGEEGFINYPHSPVKVYYLTLPNSTTSLAIITSSFVGITMTFTGECG